MSWLSLAVLLVNALSFVLNIKSIAECSRIFVRHLGDRTKHTTIRSYFNFVSWWSFVVLIKNVSNMIGALLVTVPEWRTHDTMHNIIAICLGFGALLSTVSISRYLQYLPKFNLLLLSLRRAVPVALRFTISIAFAFMGFTLCGTLWFGHYAIWFRGIEATAVTLFSAINGDILRDIFNQIYAFDLQSKILSRIFLWTYILFFTCSVLKLFLVIFEKAYFEVMAENAKTRNTMRARIKHESLNNEEDDVEEEMVSERPTVLQLIRHALQRRLMAYAESNSFTIRSHNKKSQGRPSSNLVADTHLDSDSVQLGPQAQLAALLIESISHKISAKQMGILSEEQEHTIAELRRITRKLSSWCPPTTISTDT